MPILCFQFVLLPPSGQTINATLIMKHIFQCLFMFYINKGISQSIRKAMGNLIMNESTDQNWGSAACLCLYIYQKMIIFGFCASNLKMSFFAHLWKIVMKIFIT